MSEKPIIFSAAMVNAILDGRKTNTRRLNGLDIINQTPDRYSFVGMTDDLGYPASKGFLWAGFKHTDAESPHYIKCPYGKGGDRLWVRENHQYYDWTEDGDPHMRYQADGAVMYREFHKLTDDQMDRIDTIWAELSREENYKIDRRASDKKWRPSIHMPRWASRIDLEITGIQIERLQDISEEDAKSEGAEHSSIGITYRTSFCIVWDSINQKQGETWKDNPWCWVVQFKRIQDGRGL